MHGQLEGMKVEILDDDSIFSNEDGSGNKSRNGRMEVVQKY